MPETAAGDRIDRHVSATLEVPRNQVRRWIDAARVRLNGAAVRASTSVAAGDLVSCRPPSPPPTELLAQQGEIDVLLEDAELTVIDKPADMVVHTGAGHDQNTLVNLLLHRFPEIAAVGSPERPGIVHRLDRGTTGAIVVARTPAAYHHLADAFATRRVLKIYLAVVYGHTPTVGTWDLPIARDSKDRKRMTVRGDGRPAVTRYRVLERADDAGLSLLALRLDTGRTHQIRVHAKAAGHPLVGDATYSGARHRNLRAPWRTIAEGFSRPALHAWHLAFPHPDGNREVVVTAPPPLDLAELWRALGGGDLRRLQVEDCAFP